MGLFSDLITNAKTFAVRSRVAEKLAYYRDRIDPALPDGFAEADEVQTINQFAVNPGAAETYTLDFILPDGTEVSTGNIVFDDPATTVQGDVDTALTGVVAGYEAGDVAVTDSDDGDEGLNTDDLTLTFSGDSVSGKSFGLTGVTLNDTGTLADPPSVVVTNGQQDRNVLGALKVLGVISDAAPPEEGQAGTLTATSNLAAVPQWFIRELAQEAAFTEGNRLIYDSIVAILPENNSPLIVD